MTLGTLSTIFVLAVLLHNAEEALFLPAWSRKDTRLGKGLRPYPLESIRVPTLVVSARDNGFGTYAWAEHTASRIPGAKFVGFELGGHLLAGHDETVQAEVVKLLARSANP